MSLLRLRTPGTNESGLTVSWESVTNRTYFLERGTNFGLSPAFSALATNLPGQPGTTVYTDTNAVGSQLFYYRVGVEE